MRTNTFSTPYISVIIWGQHNFHTIHICDYMRTTHFPHQTYLWLYEDNTISTAYVSVIIWGQHSFHRIRICDCMRTTQFPHHTYMWLYEDNTVSTPYISVIWGQHNFHTIVFISYLWLCEDNTVSGNTQHTYMWLEFEDRTVSADMHPFGVDDCNQFMSL